MYIFCDIVPVAPAAAPAAAVAYAGGYAGPLNLNAQLVAHPNGAVVPGIILLELLK